MNNLFCPENPFTFLHVSPFRNFPWELFLPSPPEVDLSFTVSERWAMDSWLPRSGGAAERSTTDWVAWTPEMEFLTVLEPPTIFHRPDFFWGLSLWLVGGCLLLVLLHGLPFLLMFICILVSSS